MNLEIGDIVEYFDMPACERLLGTISVVVEYKMDFNSSECVMCEYILQPMNGNKNIIRYADEITLMSDLLDEMVVL